MADAARLRDGTQIVVPWEHLEGVGTDIESEFTVTIRDEGHVARIIGSPVVIKDVSEFLARHGVPLP